MWLLHWRDLYINSGHRGARLVLGLGDFNTVWYAYPNGGPWRRYRDIEAPRVVVLLCGRKHGGKLQHGKYLQARLIQLTREIKEAARGG